MSEFNSCAGLVSDETMSKAGVAYSEAITSGKDPLQVMLDMQKGLQVALADKFEWVPHPDKLETCGEILDWMKLWDDAIDDETRELYVALGGMSNGKDASAITKVWKKNHGEARARKFADLSDDDKIEIAMELIDIWHFVLIKMLGLGLTAKDIFKLYYLKNAENFARQERGY